MWEGKGVVITLIFTLSAIVVFLAWFFVALRKDGPRRVEALTEIRDAARDLENRAQQLASPLRNPALMFQIAHRDRRKLSESEVEFLRRRLLQMSSVVSELERHQAPTSRETQQYRGRHK